MKRRCFYAVIAIALLAAALLSTSVGVSADAVSTENEDCTVVEHIPYDIISETLTQTLDDFESTASLQQWTFSDRNATANIVSAFEEYPYYPFSGLRCMEIRSTEYRTGDVFRMESTLDGAQFSDARVLFFAVNFPENTRYNAKATITLIAGGAGYRYYASLSCQDWNGVYLSLNKIPNPEEITSMRIDITYSDDKAESETLPLVVRLDCVALSSSVHAAYAADFLSDEFYTYGCNVSYNNTESRYLSVSVLQSAAAPFLESQKISRSAFDRANALRLILKNNSNCTSIKLYYTTAESNEFSESQSATAVLEPGTQIQDCYLRFENETPLQIRIVFEGASEGEIQLYSILPASTVISNAEKNGEISSCKLGSGADNVVIRGKLTADAVSSHARDLLRLYILKPWEDEKSVNYAQMSSAAQTSVTENFSFTLSYTADLLCAKYVVVLVSDTKYELLDNAKYITNPEALAQSTVVLPTPSTKKGVTSIMEQYLYMYSMQYGISQTITDLSLSDLFTATENAVVYEYNGRTYTMNRDILEELDRVVATANQEEIAVYLRLTLDQGISADINNVLITTSLRADHYGFRVSGDRAVGYLQAAGAYLAEHYATSKATSGYISGIIIGYPADQAYVNYNLGPNSLESFSANYAAAYRILYNSMRAFSPDLEFYFALSGNWDRKLSASSVLRYDAKALFDAVTERLALGGQISWNLAYSPDSNAELLTEENSDGVADTIISPANLEILCNYVKNKHPSNSTGEHKILLVSDDVIPFQRLIYTIVKMSTSVCSNISGYIVPFASIEGYENAYLLSDTTDAIVDLESIAMDFGADTWTDLIPDLDITSLAQRVVEFARTENTSEAPFAGSITFSDFSDAKDTAGWNAGYACESLSAGEDYIGFTNTMFVSLNTQDMPFSSIVNAFPYQRDLSICSVLTFHAYAVMLPDGVHEIQMKIILYSDCNYISADYVIQGGTWNSIVFDATNFSEIQHVDGIRILISGVDHTSIGDPLLILSSIQASSFDHTTETMQSFILQEQKHNTETSIDIKPERNLDVQILVLIIAATLFLEILHIIIRVILLKKQCRNDSDQS